MSNLSDAGKRLDTWLDQNDRTKAWLARELGVAPAVLWRWMAGERQPRVDFASRIELITGGYVPTSDWRPRAA